MKAAAAARSAHRSTTLVSASIRLVRVWRAVILLLHDLVKHIQTHFLDLSAYINDIVLLLRYQELVRCVRDGNLVSGYHKGLVGSTLLWLD
jgi:hypothetical protein